MAKREKPTSKLPTIIDNKEVDLFEWAGQLIEDGLNARNSMATGFSPIPGIDSYSSSYVEHVRANYAIYRATRDTALLKFSDIGNSGANSAIRLASRTKLSVLLEGEASWRYEAPDGDSATTQFVYALNQIKDIELKRQGFNRARIDALAQVSSFGTSLLGYRYSKYRRKCYFYAPDPLSFLWEYGSRDLHVEGPSQTNFLVVVDFFKKEELEYEYDVEIDDSKGHIIEPRNFNTWLAWRGGFGDKSDFTSRRIPEVKIYFKDCTHTDEIRTVKKTKQVMGEYDKETGMIPLIEEPDMDENGNQQESEEKTGRVVPSYPGYRMIVIAHHTKLYNGILPYDHRIVPFIKYANTKDGVGFTGESDIDMALPSQLKLDTMNKAIDSNVEQMPGFALVNEKKIVDKDNPIENVGGFNLMRLEKLDVASGLTLDDVVKFIQPNAVTQDQLAYLSLRVQDIFDIFGIFPGQWGRTRAADSGIKLDRQDDNSLRFHRPLLEDEVIDYELLAKMFVCNLNQFIPIDDVYDIVGRDGKPSKIVLSQHLNQTKKSFPIKIMRHNTVLSNRELMMAEALKMKEVMPNDVPATAVMKRSMIPEFVEEAELASEQRDKVVKFLEQFPPESQDALMKALAGIVQNESSGNKA